MGLVLLALAFHSGFWGIVGFGVLYFLAYHTGKERD